MYTEIFPTCGECVSPTCAIRGCAQYNKAIRDTVVSYPMHDPNGAYKPHTGMVGGIYVEIANERRRAHAKHAARGNSAEQQDWSWYRWTPVLAEELGEVAQAVQDAFDAGNENYVSALAHLKAELVQVAAMAAAWSDSVQRGIDRWEAGQ